MTDADQNYDGSNGDQDEYDYDPFEYVPDRIDQVTASGLEQLYAALTEANQPKLRSVEVEQQAGLLWILVEEGAISLDIASRQEAGR